MEKKNRNKGILIAIVVLLALGNLAVLLLWPDAIAAHLRPDQAQAMNREDTVTGDGQAALLMSEEELTFDGSGIFDPMVGVMARDVNGRDLTEMISVNYVSGKRIDEKTVRYTVFASSGTRLEAQRDLRLEHYEGPSIELEPFDSLTWEELQRLPEALIERELVHADDGFGNDASNLVGCYFELDPIKEMADIHISLYNGFQDFCSSRIIVRVEDLPEDYENPEP